MPGIAAIVALAALGVGGYAWTGQAGHAPAGSGSASTVLRGPASALDRGPAPAGGVRLVAVAGPLPPGGERSGRASAVVPVPRGAARLRISGAVTPDPMVIGGRSVYAVTVSNAGGQDAAGVTVSGVVGPGATPADLPAACTVAGQTISCGGANLTIPAGRSVTYEIPVVLDPSLPEGTTVTARADVAAPHTAEASAQLITRTRTAADVEIVASGPRAAREGAEVTYTLTVTNNGPSRAADVTVRDPMVGATVTGRPRECPGAGRTALTCPLGALAPHQSRILTFTVAPAAAGPFDHCAGVSAAGHDANTANNRSCATTTVRPDRTQPSFTPAPIEDPPTPVAAPAAEPPRPRRGTTEPSPTPAADERAAHAGAHAGVVPEPEVPAPHEPSPVNGGPPAPASAREPLPMTGVSLWLVGLGVPVLVAIGLLVRYFGRREGPGVPSGGAP
ncbi:MAG TPA: hypothetical protein VFV66_35970 [Nonomuraea sp.]|nr:hypothetical protein [Nonomuraea sp.]